jgi:hypothetical protein
LGAIVCTQHSILSPCLVIHCFACFSIEGLGVFKALADKLQSTGLPSRASDEAASSGYYFFYYLFFCNSFCNENVLEEGEYSVNFRPTDCKLVIDL